MKTLVTALKLDIKDFQEKLFQAQRLYLKAFPTISRESAGVGAKLALGLGSATAVIDSATGKLRNFREELEGIKKSSGTIATSSGFISIPKRVQAAFRMLASVLRQVVNELRKINAELQNIGVIGGRVIARMHRDVAAMRRQFMAMKRDIDEMRGHVDRMRQGILGSFTLFGARGAAGGKTAIAPRLFSGVSPVFDPLYQSARLFVRGIAWDLVSLVGISHVLGNSIERIRNGVEALSNESKLVAAGSSLLKNAGFSPNLVRQLEAFSRISELGLGVDFERVYLIASRAATAFGNIREAIKATTLAINVEAVGLADAESVVSALSKGTAENLMMLRRLMTSIGLNPERFASMNDALKEFASRIGDAARDAYQAARNVDILKVAQSNYYKALADSFGDGIKSLAILKMSFIGTVDLIVVAASGIAKTIFSAIMLAIRSVMLFVQALYDFVNMIVNLVKKLVTFGLKGEPIKDTFVKTTQNLAKNASKVAESYRDIGQSFGDWVRGASMVMDATAEANETIKAAGGVGTSFMVAREILAATRGLPVTSEQKMLRMDIARYINERKGVPMAPAALMRALGGSPEMIGYGVQAPQIQQAPSVNVYTIFNGMSGVQGSIGYVY